MPIRSSLLPLCLLLSLSTVSCQTTGRGSVSPDLSTRDTSLADAIQIPFEEFQKVLTPRGRFLPLPGGGASLVLMAMPGDAYPKIYSLDHASGVFKLKSDAGRPIQYLGRDYTLKNYYVLVDNNGDENYVIGKLDIATGRTRPFFGRPGFKAMITDFSSDGETLFVISNHEDKRVYSLYAVDRETGLHKRLTDGKQSFDSATLSPDGRWIALNQYLGNNESHLFLLDREARSGTQLRKVRARKGTNYNASFFSDDGQTLYINSNHRRDRMGCGAIPVLRPSQFSWMFAEPDRDIECHQQRPGDTTFLTETFNGETRLRPFKGLFEKEYEIPAPERAVVSNFVLLPGETSAYLRITQANNPGDFYRFEIAEGKDAKLQRLAKLNISSIPDSAFAKSYDIRYKSDDKDNLGIHGILFAKEEWTKGDAKYPVIVWPHGGPDSHERHVYHPFFQYWALNGFIVFAPNFRGSTGYGKRFETLNDKDWGGGHIRDLIAGKQAIAQLPYVDPDRIFIVGASFGGYSTLSAITQYPNEFKGAVAIVALANLFTFMKSIPPDLAWQTEFKTELGDPVKDAALYKARSPYFFADKIRIPLKIYQAENDVRTVKAEMDQFVARLREHKIPVDYVVLEKEGHGFTRTDTWKNVLQGTVEFLKSIPAP